MLNETLAQLGFGEKEIRIYAAVLQYGKIRPANLAELVGLNRSTVYSVAKELAGKGVIAQDLAGKGLYLVAKPVSELAVLARKEEMELQQKRELIAVAVKELESLPKQKAAYAAPKIVFIAERELEAHLYRQTALWAESIRQGDGIWWGFQDHTFVEHYETWIDWSWESGVQTGVSLKLLSNKEEKQVKHKTFKRRVVRFWKESQNFTASTWVCGDYVIMLITRQRPHYLVEILDATMAHNLREVFKGIWKTQIEKPS